MLQKLRRLEEADNFGIVECVTCRQSGKFPEDFRIDYRVANGSHYWGRQWTATAFIRENIWPCCVNCNDNLSGNLPYYKDFLIARYGEDWFWQHERLHRKTVRLASIRDWMIEQRELWQEEVKYHERRIGPEH